jgi:diguanylate cyclase (GGDEF)-like protein
MIITQALGLSEQINEMIRQSFEALSCINTDIKRELAHTAPLPWCKDALEKSEAVGKKLKDASERLTAMSQALANDVRERTLLEHQLAAAMEQEQGARNAALHDKLTGLPNRTLYHDRLEHEIAQAKRHHWMLAVMFLDLDKFKSVNDTYGHEAGDEVLQGIATRLKHATRDEDTVSRYGGDEFVYLLGGIRDQKDIAMVASKILRAIQTPCNLSVRDVVVELSLQASMGISIYPRDGETARALIVTADRAMYRAKENRSGYAFAI